jgi:hypothetical protein
MNIASACYRNGRKDCLGLSLPAAIAKKLNITPEDKFIIRETDNGLFYMRIEQ